MPETSNISPAEYSSKMNVPLERDMPAHAALSRVLLFNLDIMEINENGIRQDTNIEFLHDFRVANRRSRSLVSQVRRVFHKADLEPYKKAFSWLSKVTGTHRDLDVFLADFAIYESRIPGNGSDALEPLRELLHRTRQREHEQLLQALASDRFVEFKNSWRHFLEKEKHETTLADEGMAPVLDVASRSIWKNYRKLLKQGDRITTRYTFESIHKLRKDGKKLRYLLEAFKSLYPEKDLLQVIKSLKKLQNNLGDIVDMHIQRFMLEGWKRELQDSNPVPVNTIKAINHLEKVCMREEKKAAKKFKKRIHRFSNRGNHELFSGLFS